MGDSRKSALLGLDHTVLLWSPWYSLSGASRNQEIPRAPGLYRIRRADIPGLDYVGQTGVLRQRMGNLNNVYGDVMPYNAPHTAGPGFWALRQDHDCEFEVSVAEVSGGVAVRKGIECLIISEHRVEHGRSPTLSFGRMPDGWTKSSDNTARLVAAGRRHRGQRDPNATRVLDAPPPASLIDDPRAGSWLGHRWISAAETPPSANSVGLYRSIRLDGEGLVYVGQGRIAARVNSHVAKGEDPDHSQHRFFAGNLTWDWVDLPEIDRTQLLELENDLIASHVRVCGRTPSAQFLG